MNSSPVVTILLPVYNCGKCLLNAVNSVVAQSFKDWKLLIIDDGSTRAETIEMLNQLRQKNGKIEIIGLAENRGIINALNTGLKYANTKYVARIDCDDLWKPDKLKKQVEFLEANPDYAMVGTWADVISFGQTVSNPHQAKYTGYQVIKNNLFKYNFIVHSSVVVRREIIQKEKYSARFKHVEDYELWLRMACKYKIEILPENLTVYNFDKNSVSYKYAVRQKINEILLKLSYIRKYRKKHYLLYNIYELLKLMLAKTVKTVKTFSFRTK